MLNTEIEMNIASDIFKLLGHETRLTILKILIDHDCCVCEFVDLFQTSQPSISQHLRRLKDNGLITEERRGQWTYYSMNKRYAHYHFIVNILNLLPNQTQKLKQLKDTRKQCE